MRWNCDYCITCNCIVVNICCCMLSCSHSSNSNRLTTEWITVTRIWLVWLIVIRITCKRKWFVCKNNTTSNSKTMLTNSDNHVTSCWIVSGIRWSECYVRTRNTNIQRDGSIASIRNRNRSSSKWIDSWTWVCLGGIKTIHLTCEWNRIVVNNNTFSNTQSMSSNGENHVTRSWIISCIGWSILLIGSRSTYIYSKCICCACRDR